jgi:hypothetical protein
MKLGSVAVAYQEPRFIAKHVGHLQVEDRLVLSSTIPWNGKASGEDKTAELARSAGARVIENYWPTEQDQRNTGQDMHADKDWIIVLDPDEFLSDEDWAKLKVFLEATDADAVVAEGQYTYWKNGWVADPPKDYQMLIAVRPHVRFIDKRVVNTRYVTAPVWVHHFSWARTDDEVWSKISHYAHKDDFNIEEWYENVWKKWQPGIKDVHPTTPETLHDFKRADLPPERQFARIW